VAVLLPLADGASSTMGVCVDNLVAGVPWVPATVNTCAIFLIVAGTTVATSLHA